MPARTRSSSGERPAAANAARSRAMPSNSSSEPVRASSGIQPSPQSATRAQFFSVAFAPSQSGSRS